MRRTLALVSTLLALTCGLSMFGLAQDADPPDIEMVTQFPITIFEGDEVVVEVNIVDTSGVQTATIFYDVDGVEYSDQLYAVGPPEPSYRYQWDYTNEDIGEKAEVVVTILNITASDVHSNSVTQTYGNFRITVLKEDVEGPDIEPEATPLYTESEDHMIIRARVEDPSGVESVVLHYSKDSQWYQKPMTINEPVGLYEAIIGPFETDTAIKYYINATDQSSRYNRASTLDVNRDMESFVASFRQRFEGAVDRSEYLQVEELHRYRMTTSRDTIIWENYVFGLQLSETGRLTGNVSVSDNGTLTVLTTLNLVEKNNVIITDQISKDGVVYDFNLKYMSYSSAERWAEIEINPRQKLVFEGYEITTSINKVDGPDFTFSGPYGNWRVNVTVRSGYQSLTRSFNSRNQFKTFYLGAQRDIQILYLGQELVEGDIIAYRARYRVYKFQPPVFEVVSDLATGSPSELSEDQIVYNVYHNDTLMQTVIAQNLAGSRAYDMTLVVTNVTQHGLVVTMGELTSSLGPVYKEKKVGNQTIRYYLSYGTLTRSFQLVFTTDGTIRESAGFDVLLSYKDAHGDAHQVRIPIQFLIYPFRPKLQVDKQISRDPLWIGKSADVSIEIENIGRTPAQDVTVVDSTPPNLISDFEVWQGEVRAGSANKKSIIYAIKPTTITKPGRTSYGFVTIEWKGPCHKEGVRQDIYSLSTEEFYFTAQGPHIKFTEFATDRPLVEKGGQTMIFINVGEKVKVTATVTNDGNQRAENLTFDFPGFYVESTNFPMGTDVEVGQFFTFTATIVAIAEGNLPFQARIVHYDILQAELGNVYTAVSDYVLAQTYLSPVLVEFIDTPSQISAGETETISLSIRNIGSSSVSNARVLLSLTGGLSLVQGTYLIFEGNLGPLENIPPISIEIKGEDFGPSKITATASGRDIPSIDYELHIEVLSPHIEVVRTIDDPYMLARQEFWPRASEIVSRVTLRLTNTGNDVAMRIRLEETLPSALISFDNLTFGSKLIIWGEGGELSLAPNESTSFEYPVWSHTSGHYTYSQAVAKYTNTRDTSYESRSNSLEVWVLSGRPFLVSNGAVSVLDGEGSQLSGPASYNDTVTFRLSVRNIGNQRASGLSLDGWLGQEVGDLQCTVLNRDEILATLASGVEASATVEISVSVAVLEDLPFPEVFDLSFPMTYEDDVGRTFKETLGARLSIRPTTVAVSFTKAFWRSSVSPGERPEIRFRVSNDGDTALSNLRAVLEIPEGLTIEESSVIPVLGEGEEGSITVVFEPVDLPEGEVYQLYQGFVAQLEFESFRGMESTLNDGDFLSLSIAEPFVEITRSITSENLLARNDDWPYSAMIHENVTITLTNRAEVQARGLLVVESIPEGLFTLESLGSSQIIWGQEGGINLDKGQSISFTYPVWSFEEGSAEFEPALVTYKDPQNNEYRSYSTGAESVQTLLSRPYVVWDGETTQDPVGSITYNDTVYLTLRIQNIGNSKCCDPKLQGWSEGQVPEGWELLNPAELGNALETGLLAGTYGEFVIGMRCLKDFTTTQNVDLGFLLTYSDDASRNYTSQAQASILVRPPKISLSTTTFDKNDLLMPHEKGYMNVTLRNTGDTDLTDLNVTVQTPEGITLHAADSLAVLGEGQAVNISIVFNGIDIGESIGKLYAKINVSLSYRDFRGLEHTKRAGQLNFTLKRPMLMLRTYDVKPKTRIGGRYRLELVLANDGTTAAREIRILLGDLGSWVGSLSVEGDATVQGGEAVLSVDLGSLEELELKIVGKVREKGEFTVYPTIVYSDAAGNLYQLLPDSVQVKSGERLYKMILPFLIWAGVGAAIAGVYYYETRIAEKIKGHQLGSLASSVITHVDATQLVPPLIPFKKKKLSLAEFSHLLSLYLIRAKSTSVKRADKTTFIIAHPQSRLVPGQDFKNLVVIKDAYMLLAQMVANRVKTSQVVPPTFLVQGFKVGVSDLAYILSLAVSKVRTEGTLPRSVVVPHATRVSAASVEQKKEVSQPLEPPKETLDDSDSIPTSEEADDMSMKPKEQVPPSRDADDEK